MKSKAEKKLVELLGGTARFESMKKENWTKIVKRLERIEAESRLKILFSWTELPPILAPKPFKN